VNALSFLLKGKYHVKKGDRVLIYMPMVAEAVFGMLACARIGAIHSVVFGGFAAAELAKRIKDFHPKIILTASVGIEPKRLIRYLPLVEQALRLCVNDKPPTDVLVYDRGIGQDEMKVLDHRFKNWKSDVDAVKNAGGYFVEPEEMRSTDPLYLIYTSGSTGTPKGIIRDCGGYTVALKYSMENIYGASPGEVFFTASDLGWILGHRFEES
jgi:propionyl-CoA synthetase